MRAGETGFTLTAKHADGELLQFHVMPSTDGSWQSPIFISNAMIRCMRAGISADAAALARSYKAIFNIHASLILSKTAYDSAETSDEAALL